MGISEKSSELWHFELLVNSGQNPHIFRCWEKEDSFIKTLKCHNFLVCAPNLMKFGFQEPNFMLYKFCKRLFINFWPLMPFLTTAHVFMSFGPLKGNSANLTRVTHLNSSRVGFRRVRAFQRCMTWLLRAPIDFSPKYEQSVLRSISDLKESV